MDGERSSEPQELEQYIPLVRVCVPRNHANTSLTSVITGLVSTAVIQVAFSSAVVTGDFKDQEEHFGVSAEVIALTVSLTVCGFG